MTTHQIITGFATVLKWVLIWFVCTLTAALIDIWIRGAVPLNLIKP